MRSLKFLSLILLLALAAAPLVRAADSTPKVAKHGTVLLPSRSPLVSFRFVFHTGAAADPKGKEGLAALTSALLSEGGSKTMTRAEILKALYPMASEFDSQTDKEMTVFYGSTHIENLDAYYALVRQMLLEPGFRDDDFQRVRTDMVNFLKTTLRAGNDEELGKEHLYTMIYPPAHPYGHHNYGTISSLEKITLDDVKGFYREHYTQSNLVLGLAGAFPDALPQKISADFATLPEGKTASLKTTAPLQEKGTKIDIIQRETRSTAISLGFPIPVNRSHQDYAALALVASYFGQHRSSSSYLYQRIRALRGLNYGDYAYIEYFPRGMYRFEPSPNLARSSQIFQIWIRPVEPQNGLFTLRAALYEYDKLVREGMSQEAFDSTRQFLRKYVNVLTATQDAQLGYALDSRYYGTREFTTHMRAALDKLTLDDVNKAIHAYLKTDSLRVAMVTKDGEGLRKAILAGTPATVNYTAPKPKEVLEEDAVISKYPIPVKEGNVRVVPVEKVFQ
ncbi:MAG TPA: insulinase family protein [Terriglobales bacterium]|nr:insulinase family protein [Terriglobales bacterium]